MKSTTWQWKFTNRELQWVTAHTQTILRVGEYLKLSSWIELSMREHGSIIHMERLRGLDTFAHQRPKICSNWLMINFRVRKNPLIFSLMAGMQNLVKARELNHKLELIKLLKTPRALSLRWVEHRHLKVQEFLTLKSSRNWTNRPCNKARSFQSSSNNKRSWNIIKGNFSSQEDRDSTRMLIKKLFHRDQTQETNSSLLSLEKTLMWVNHLSTAL